MSEQTPQINVQEAFDPELRQAQADMNEYVATRAADAAEQAQFDNFKDYAQEISDRQTAQESDAKLDEYYDEMSMPKLARELAKASHEGDKTTEYDISVRLGHRMNDHIDKHSSERDAEHNSDRAKNLVDRLSNVKRTKLEELNAPEKPDDEPTPDAPETPSTPDAPTAPEAPETPPTEPTPAKAPEAAAEDNKKDAKKKGFLGRVATRLRRNRSEDSNDDPTPETPSTPDAPTAPEAPTTPETEPTNDAPETPETQNEADTETKQQVPRKELEIDEARRLVDEAEKADRNARRAALEKRVADQIRYKNGEMDADEAKAHEASEKEYADKAFAEQSIYDGPDQSGYSQAGVLEIGANKLSATASKRLEKSEAKKGILSKSAKKLSSISLPRRSKNRKDDAEVQKFLEDKADEAERKAAAAAEAPTEVMDPVVPETTSEDKPENQEQAVQLTDTEQAMYDEFKAAPSLEKYQEFMDRILKENGGISQADTQAYDRYLQIQRMFAEQLDGTSN